MVLQGGVPKDWVVPRAGRSRTVCAIVLQSVPCCGQEDLDRVDEADRDLMCPIIDWNLSAFEGNLSALSLARKGLSYVILRSRQGNWLWSQRLSSSISGGLPVKCWWVWNEHLGQQFLDGPNVIGEGSSHSWRPLSVFPFFIMFP